MPNKLSKVNHRVSHVAAVGAKAAVSGAKAGAKVAVSGAKAGAKVAVSGAKVGAKVAVTGAKVGAKAAVTSAKGTYRFMKNWSLPFSMLAGATGYFVFVSIPGHEAVTPFANRAIAIIQPCLIFAMLFVTFCKVKLSDLRLSRWHSKLILVQVCSFAVLTAIAAQFPNGDVKAVIESAMLCLICPTATAAAVVTGRLGGNAASLVSYTILSNLAAAIAIPVLLPFCHPNPDATFIASLMKILAKVFPLLICPLIAATLLDKIWHSAHEKVANYHSLAFKLWVVALALAITVTTKSLVHTEVSLACQGGIALVSLVACVLQFAVGKHIGSRYGETISAGQALGQKNTVFAIWLGYTFLTPVTAIAGGFYSIWHNLINSWQLYKKKKEQQLAEAQ